MRMCVALINSLTAEYLSPASVVRYVLHGRRNHIYTQRVVWRVATPTHRIGYPDYFKYIFRIRLYDVNTVVYDSTSNFALIIFDFYKF